MSKIYIVYVEHCSDGERETSLYPCINKEVAKRVFDEQVEEIVSLPCYLKCDADDITEDLDDECLYIKCETDDYWTDVHIKELDIIE